MRPARVLAAVSAATLAAAALAGPAGARSQTAAPSVAHTGHGSTYLVLTKTPAQAKGVAASLKARGAKIRSVNTAIGMVEAVSDDANFRAHASSLGSVDGVARDQTIGRAPVQRRQAVEQENRQARKGAAAATSRPRVASASSTPDPLDGYLWGMKMVRADLAHEKSLGSHEVRVGVIDTGIQGDHPDLAPNFNASLSRNFTIDNENGVDDGPCEHPGCVDPVGEDDGEHGTHVAGTIAAALNGFGLSGVAPDVTLVNVRAGQDSGYFFAGPTVNALTYAADAGIDVVNMSFYVDPWLYNCVGGAPEDTPAQAADQNTIIKAMTRALNYANKKRVTLVAAAGNDHTDMANPPVDQTSPDFGEPPHPRTIDNDTCSDLPVEGPHVIGVTALGPSANKSDYSNYTTEPGSGEIEVSAPGGWFRDYFGTPQYRTNENEILSTAPLKPLQESGYVDGNGDITPDGEAVGIKKECQTGTPAPGTTPCGYYQYLQGTSMATPHATGVAALAIAAHGTGSGAGFGLAPVKVKRLLMGTATNHACPNPPTVDYLDEGRDASYTATCVGDYRFNGFYGDGIVNALGVLQ